MIVIFCHQFGQSCLTNSLQSLQNSPHLLSFHYILHYKSNQSEKHTITIEGHPHKLQQNTQPLSPGLETTKTLSKPPLHSNPPLPHHTIPIQRHLSLQKNHPTPTTTMQNDPTNKPKPKRRVARLLMLGDSGMFFISNIT